LGPTATPRGDIKVTGTVSVLAAGDNLFHNGILLEAKEKAQALGNGTDFSFDFIYTNVRSRIQAADISVINQESLILPKRYLSNNISRYIRSDGSFVAPEELTQTLVDIGFDVMDKANNHMLDMGSGGMKWGVDYMNTVTGIKAVGAYYDEAGSEQVCVIEKNGVKIAFLAYTYGTNVPQWKASWEAPEFPYYIPLPEDEKMIADLKRADDAADFTAVLIHWGTEQQERPSDDQRRIAKVLAENGAGIIIGHHPHCLQSIEYVSD
jgi:poly-gamma-glutamate synthesis protein (capsule biosynthesis protein)